MPGPLTSIYPESDIAGIRAASEVIISKPGTGLSEVHPNEAIDPLVPLFLATWSRDLDLSIC
jgi:hypothetical protein